MPGRIKGALMDDEQKTPVEHKPEMIFLDIHIPQKDGFVLPDDFQ